ALATVEAICAMYERAIAICEAHRMDDWIVYPQALLAWVLVDSGADVARAEALVRACLPRAEAQQNRRLLVDLGSSQMWIATARADWEALRKAFCQSLVYGGLAEVSLKMLLTKIEKTCHERGTDATFIELCRFMADAYDRAGLEAPLQHWYPAPTSPLSPPGEPEVREEFEAERWHPALVWQDFTGRSRLDLSTRPGWLVLSPAPHTDLWPETN